jgi:hypothetical protein
MGILEMGNSLAFPSGNVFAHDKDHCFSLGMAVKQTSQQLADYLLRIWQENRHLPPEKRLPKETK